MWRKSNADYLIENKLIDSKKTSEVNIKINYLLANTNYIVKSYAKRKDNKIQYGAEVAFTTKAFEIPSVITKNVLNIEYNSLTFNGSVVSNGGSKLINMGVCWSLNSNPIITDNKIIINGDSSYFSTQINNLNSYTKYFIRAFASNATGTAYGTILEVTTKLKPIIQGNGVTDIEGNIYASVIIGDAEWMAENLKVTKLNDNTDLQLEIRDASWGSAGLWPRYCWYKNEEVKYKNLYGALYDGLSAENVKICPSGWHVPNNIEWSKLIEIAGGWDKAGKKLKQVGTINWRLPNDSVTNETGFTALPGGERTYSNGMFRYLNEIGRWWSTSPSLDGNGNKKLRLYYLFNDSYRIQTEDMHLIEGASIRCVKD